MKEYLNAIKKEIIRDKYLLLIDLFLISLFLIPVNFYIEIGGGMKSIGNRVQVENGYKEKGSLNIVYVKELDGTIATKLLSFIIPDWEATKITNYQYNNEETIKDLTTRAKLDLKETSNNAIKYAYEEANKECSVKSEKLIVYATYDDYKTKLKVGDQIIKIDNINTNNLDDIKDFLNTKKENDIVKIEYKRNNEINVIDNKIYRNNKTNSNILGISIVKDITYNTNPKVKIKFKKNEEGPSGGLLTALKIYNSLTEKDITKGKVIAATGTLESDGSIGEIGGIKYKVIGAKKADIFLVPEENYQEAITVAKKKKLKVKIISVSTFKDAINKLNKELT